MKKRILAIALTVAMLLSMLPAQVFAAQTDGVHTEHTYTEVQSQQVESSSVLDLLDYDAAVADLEYLSETIGCRYAGSASEQKALAYAQAELEALGYEIESQEFSVSTGFSDVYLGDLTLVAKSAVGSSAEGTAVYLDDPANAEALGTDLSGKIVFFPGNWNAGKDEDTYTAITALDAAGAAGIVVMLDGSIDDAAAYKNWLPDADSARLEGITTPVFCTNTLEAERVPAYLAENAGATVRIETNDSPVSGNVIGRKEAAVETELTLYVTAHIDSVMPSPGANDNGSGVAGVLALARAFEDVETNCNIEFVLFGAEEIGLFGSKHFVNNLTEDEVANAIGNYNMDMIAPKDCEYICLDTFTKGAECSDEPNTHVTRLAWEAAEGLGYDMEYFYVASGGTSDHKSFHNKGIPAVCFNWEAVPESHSLEPYYHTGKDNMEINFSEENLAKSLNVIFSTVYNDATAEYVAVVGEGVYREYYTSLDDAYAAAGDDSAVRLLQPVESEPVELPFFVDYDAALADLEYLSGELGDRVAGSADELAAQDYVAEVLQGLGYEVSTQTVAMSSKAAGPESKNVVAVKKASRETDLTIYVSAHIDSVANAPGANDNGSGVVGMLAIARAMKDITTNYNIVFVSTCAEEIGLLGSRHFAGNLTDEEVANAICNYNIDMVATKDEDCIYMMMMMTSDGQDNHASLATRNAALSLGYSDTQFNTAGGVSADHHAFHEQGIPAVEFYRSEVIGFSYNQLEEYYHTPQDSINDNFSVERLKEILDPIALAVYNDATADYAAVVGEGTAREYYTTMEAAVEAAGEDGIITDLKAHKNHDGIEFDTVWDSSGKVTFHTPSNSTLVYYLTDDVNIESLAVQNGIALHICLNGHSLSLSGFTNLSNGGTLYIHDCKGSGSYNTTYTAMLTGSVHLLGGTYNTTSSDSNYFYWGGSEFHLDGGTLTGIPNPNDGNYKIGCIWGYDGSSTIRLTSGEIISNSDGWCISQKGAETVIMDGSVKLTTQEGVPDIYLAGGGLLTLENGFDPKGEVYTLRVETTEETYQITSGWSALENQPEEYPFAYYNDEYVVMELTADSGSKELFLVLADKVDDYTPHEHNDQTFSTPLGADDWHNGEIFPTDASGSYYLTAGITTESLKAIANADGDVTIHLCLNGQTVTGSHILRVAKADKLYIYDCSQTDNALYVERLQIYEGGEIHLVSGKVVQSTADGSLPGQGESKLFIEGGTLVGTPASGTACTYPSQDGASVILTSGELRSEGEGWAVAHIGVGSVIMNGSIKLTGGNGAEEIGDIYLGKHYSTVEPVITLEQGFEPNGEIYGVEVGAGIYPLDPGSAYRITDGWGALGDEKPDYIPFESTQGYKVVERDYERADGTTTRELYLTIPVHEHYMAVDTDNGGLQPDGVTDVKKTTTFDIEIGSLEDLKANCTVSGSTYTLNPGNYVLVGDITNLDFNIRISGEVKLCLNGYSICKSTGVPFQLTKAAAELSICSCSEGSCIETKGASNSNIEITSAGGGTLNIFGGTIGGTAMTGIAANKGTVRIFGGTVTSGQNTNSNARGLWVNNCQAYIYGGTVSGMTGVAVRSTGNLTVFDGAVIQGKTAAVDIQSGGTATVNGGQLSATGDNGIANAGTLTVSGGTISATQYGINQNGTFVLSGSPTINGAEADVYLPGGKHITVGETLSAPEGETYSVETQALPEIGASVQITEEWNTYFPEETVYPFTSANPAYSVIEEEDGELYLAKVHKHPMSADCVTGTDVNFTNILTADTFPSDGILDGGADGKGFVLMEPITHNGLVIIRGKVDLCLNGYTLDVGDYQVYVEENAELNLCDCNSIGSESGGQILGKANICYERADGEEVVKSVLASHKATATIRIYGGTIQNTGEEYGVGGAGSIYFYDGKILSGSGEAVRVSGLFEMYGGIVKATSDHALTVVKKGAEAKIYAGTVSSDGSSSYGAYVMGGTLTVDGKDVSITGKKGIGILSTNKATAILTNGTITATSTKASDPAVYNKGTLEINGPVTITTTSGLGVENIGTMTMSDGSVTLTKADSVGIKNTGTVSISGGTIAAAKYGVSHNEGTLNLSGDPVINGTSAGDIYLDEGMLITVDGEINGEDTYSVDTYATPAEGAPVQVTTEWDSAHASCETEGCDHLGDCEVGTFTSVDGHLVYTDGDEIYLGVHHIHCVYGANCADIKADKECTHEKIDFDQPLNQTLMEAFPRGDSDEDVFVPSGRYFLTRDIDMSFVTAGLRFKDGATVYLCLNGHSITNQVSFRVEGNATVYICDCKNHPETGENQGRIDVDEKVLVGNENGNRVGAKLYFHGGTINVHEKWLQPLYVYDSSEFVLDGGTIVVNGDSSSKYGTEAIEGYWNDEGDYPVVILKSGTIKNTGTAYTVGQYGDTYLTLSGTVKFESEKAPADFYLFPDVELDMTLLTITETFDPQGERYSVYLDDKVENYEGNRFRITDGWSKAKDAVGYIPFYNEQGWEVIEMDYERPDGTVTRELYLTLHSHLACDGSCMDAQAGKTCSHPVVSYTTAIDQDFIDAQTPKHHGLEYTSSSDCIMLPAGSYYLTGPITTDKRIVFCTESNWGGDVYLCLNGWDLTATGFHVCHGVNLYLCNCGSTGEMTVEEIGVFRDAELHILDGTVNMSGTGGAVFGYMQSRIVLDGGTLIAGENNTFGDAVCYCSIGFLDTESEIVLRSGKLINYGMGNGVGHIGCGKIVMEGDVEIEVANEARDASADLWLYHVLNYTERLITLRESFAPNGKVYTVRLEEGLDYGESYRITEGWGAMGENQPDYIPFSSIQGYMVVEMDYNDTQELYLVRPEADIYLWSGHSVTVSGTELMQALNVRDSEYHDFVGDKTYAVTELEPIDGASVADAEESSLVFTGADNGEYPEEVWITVQDENGSETFYRVRLNVHSYNAEDSIYILDYSNPLKIPAGDILPGIGEGSVLTVETMGKNAELGEDGLSLRYDPLTTKDIKYGMFDIIDNAATYTPNTMLNGRDEVTVIFRVYKDGAAPSEIGVIDPFKEAEMYKTITVIPANVVYYEDTSAALEWNSDSTVITVTSQGNTSVTWQDGSNSGEYGNDPSYTYAPDSYNGSGGSHKEITVKGEGTILSFTFTGMGFDVLGTTNAVSGKMEVRITDESGGTEYFPVVTSYANGEITEAPLVHKELPYGTYTVEIKAVPEYDWEAPDDQWIPHSNPTYAALGIKQPPIKEYKLWLDGVRVYNPLNMEDANREHYTETEREAEVAQLRDLILEGKAASASFDGNGTFTYGAGNVFYVENMKSYSGTHTEDINEYLVKGPNNELYFNSATQSVVLYVRETGDGVHMLQIGVRNLNPMALGRDGSAVGKPGVNLITADGTAVSIVACDPAISYTEQYYTVDYTNSAKETIDGVEYYRVVLSAANADAFAVSNLKYSGLEFAEIPGAENVLVYDENGELVQGGAENMPNVYSLARQLKKAYNLLPEDDFDADMKFRSVALTLANSIGMNIYVNESALEGYENPYVLIEKLYADGVVYETCKVYPTETADSRINFYYDDISAKEMSATVRMTLFATKDGVLTRGATRDYGVLTYATNTLGKTSDPALRTLLVDMLNYGAQAQDYFDFHEEFLANSTLTAEQKAWATAEEPTLVNGTMKDNPAIPGSGSYPFAITSASLVLEDKVDLTFYMSAGDGELTGKKLIVSYVNGAGKEIREEISAESFVLNANGRYEVTYDALAAMDMRVLVTCWIADGNGERLSNAATYGVECYAASKVKNEDLKPLLLDMMRYGDSARNYFSAEAQG